MPKLIYKEDTTKTAAIIASLETAGINVNNGDFCNAICSAKSLEFFDTLSKKLVLVTEALQEQFTELKTAAYARVSDGPVMASIDAPSLPIGVKYEYIEYIKRYGPPPEGVFDPALLYGIRLEFGIKTT
jgi:hypothetical protein